MENILPRLPIHFIDPFVAPSPIAAAPTSITLFVGRTPLAAANTPTPVSSFASFQQLFGTLNPAYPLTYALWLFFQNGGTHALVLSTGTAPTSPTPDPHLAALASLSTPFNILVLPPDTLNGDLDSALLNAALALCVQQQAMLLFDAPAAWSTRAAAGDLTFTPADLNLAPAASLANCALYLPRIILPDPLTPNSTVTLTAAPAIAAIFAVTDANSGVWKSPAGIDAPLNGITSLAARLTDAGQATLNVHGINCLRSFPNEGILVWGARTLSTDANDRYISIRRFMLFLQTSLQQGLTWTALAPNSPQLWSAITATINSFLTTLWQSGALLGSRPQDAFFVSCNPSNNTAQDVAQGLVNIQVGFAPLRPAEFLIIEIQSLTANSTATPHKPKP